MMAYITVMSYSGHIENYVICTTSCTDYAAIDTHLAETFCLSQNLDSFTLNHGKIRSIC